MLRAKSTSYAVVLITNSETSEDATYKRMPTPHRRSTPDQLDDLIVLPPLEERRKVSPRHDSTKATSHNLTMGSGTGPWAKMIIPECRLRRHRVDRPSLRYRPRRQRPSGLSKIET